jgi:hypothetical protein
MIPPLFQVQVLEITLAALPLLPRFIAGNCGFFIELVLRKEGVRLLPPCPPVATPLSRKRLTGHLRHAVTVLLKRND